MRYGMDDQLSVRRHSFQSAYVKMDIILFAEVSQICTAVISVKESTLVLR